MAKKKIGHVSIDVEADGPCAGLYSMVSFGAVLVEPDLHLGTRSFYSDIMYPVSSKWVPEALAISGVSRELMEKNGKMAADVMSNFDKWLTGLKEKEEYDRLVMVSDNPAFDWQFINYYFHIYLGRNPLGFSARRIGDYYAGLMGNWNKQSDVKKLRDTPHTHNPVDDARGNAEALLKCWGTWPKVVSKPKG